MTDNKSDFKASGSGDNNNSQTLPPGFDEAVLRPSQPLPEGVDTKVRGYDFNEGINYESLLTSYTSIGFQATHFARAVDVLNEVVSCYLDGLLNKSRLRLLNSLIYQISD